MKKSRSNCPQSLILEIIGDPWTLLIIRDMMLNEKRYFREFLESKEKIASNILSGRLKLLEEEKIIWRARDDHHKQKIRYSLTQKGIDLLPILIENARWSLTYKSVDTQDKIKAEAIIEGGPQMLRKMIEDLQVVHLDHKNSLLNRK